jgi:hypothetical protein
MPPGEGPYDWDEDSDLWDEDPELAYDQWLSRRVPDRPWHGIDPFGPKKEMLAALRNIEVTVKFEHAMNAMLASSSEEDRARFWNLYAKLEAND